MVPKNLNGDIKNKAKASIANGLGLIASSIGLPMEKLLKDTGMSVASLIDLDSRVPDRAVMKFLQAIDRLMPRKPASLEIAKRFPISALGREGELVFNAPNLDTFLQLLSSHYDLFIDRIEVQYIFEGDTTALRFYHPLDEEDGGIGGELTVAIIFKLIQMKFGNQCIAKIKFRHDIRCEKLHYDEFFNCALYFKQQHNELIFDTKNLELKSKDGAHESYTYLNEQLLKIRRKDACVLQPAELQPYLLAIERNAANGIYSAQALASEMAMSLRSLQRKLRSSNTSARALIDEYRYKQTLKMLTDNNLKLEDVAYRQGFESERGFRKAFKRWANNTPGAVRMSIDDTSYDQNP